MSVLNCIKTVMVACLAIGVVTGCRGDRVQSTLHAAGPPARAVADLWWVMFAVLGIYTLAVFAITGYGIWRKPPAATDDQTPEKNEFFGSTKLILLGGIILPTLILVPLLIYSSAATASMRYRPSGLTIRVIGHRWWWEVQYPDHHIETANQLVVPVGQPVRLELAAGDVIHSFWVPQLHGKTDMLPGKVTVTWLLAERPGIYRGQCAEYCGLQHALMAFEVLAVPPAEFVQWLNHAGPTGQRPTGQRQAVQQPAGEGALETNAVQHPGEAAFFRHGCAACHAIAGTAALGRMGPDLSDLADRRMLAAATLLNTREDLFRWLKDPQSIKPGVKMPATLASDEELWDMVDYLMELKSGKLTLPGGTSDPNS
jgi:cytochrome c oxidase subunit II